MREKQSDRREKGWNPDAKSGEEGLTTDERSLDVGESGQFAPGGYYNQRTKQEPERTLDDDVVPPGRR
jgi:hypothetical protein